MNTTESPTSSSLYRAVWRWHFYAGLLTIPFLVLLSITGGLYLFRHEINFLVHRELIEVPARPAPLVSPAAVQQAMEAATGGSLLQMTVPGQPDRSIVAIVRMADGMPRHVYADPYDGTVLGSTRYNGVMDVVRSLHSLTIGNTSATAITEIAAGWVIVLLLTGTFLWWPRGASGGVLTVRGAPDRRIFWRDLHAVAGALGGGIVLFLAVSGMPWSVFWGAQVQSRVAVGERGVPAAPAAVTPYFMLGTHAEPGGGVMEHHDHGGAEPVPGTPWALEQLSAPSSVGTGEPIGLDAAFERFDALGLTRPYGVQPPEGPNGAYAATLLGDKANATRRLYIDQYTGESLGEIAFADYGWASKAIEYGIAIHEGRQFGELNRYVMLLGCLTGLLLAVSSVTMWWKRRPKGTLAAPPAPEERRVKLFVLGAIAVVGLIYPLTGASLLVALLLDFTWQRVIPRRRAATVTSS